MNIQLLTPDEIVAINKEVCAREKQNHLCFDEGKVASAMAAAFYPGDYPFQYGGIAKVAGALCFFLTKAHAFMDGNKRTAGLTASIFMDINGYNLIYPLDVEKNINAFAEIIDQTAASIINKEQLIEWFDQHKVASVFCSTTNPLKSHIF